MKCLLPYCRLLMVLGLLLPCFCQAQSTGQEIAAATDSVAGDSSSVTTMPPAQAVKPNPFNGRGRPTTLHMGPVNVDGKAFIIDYELPYEGYVYMYLFDSNNDRVGVAAWVKKVGYHTARLSRKHLRLGEMYTLTLNYKGQMLQAQFQNGEQVQEQEVIEPENTTNDYDPAGWDPNDFDWEASSNGDEFDYGNAQYEDEFNYDEWEDEGYIEAEDSEFNYGR